MFEAQSISPAVPSDMGLFALVVVAYLCALLILVGPMVFAHPLKRRVKELTGAIPVASEARPEGKSASRESDKRGGPNALLNRWLNRVALRAFGSVKANLHSAGKRSSRALSIYIAAKLLFPLFAFFLVWSFLRGTVMANSPDMAVMLLAVSGGIAGVWAPDLIVKNMKIRYLDRLRRDWPNALDLLYLCINAGLGLEAALAKVARDLAGSAPELSQELTLTVAELAFLQDRRTAIENMGRRIDLPMIREATRALSQAQLYGMPLGTTLRNLSEESRRQRINAAEKKAASLPSRLRIPLILFLIPVLFVVILAPAVIEVFGLS